MEGFWRRGMSAVMDREDVSVSGVVYSWLVFLDRS